VRLLDTTLVRIGNDEYARENGSYGLTTLRPRHAAVKGSRLQLRFRGKSGVWHEVALEDPQVARIVRACQAMPGQELFTYEDDDGQTRSVGSADVNDYLKSLLAGGRRGRGSDFSAKDFRTWHASVHAMTRLAALPGDRPVARRQANEVLREVAGLLGNTLAVCRKSYVHPHVVAAAVERGSQALRPQEVKRCRGLTAAECRLLGFLSAAPGPAEGAPGTVRR
jgi:DNA topoisomerase-1